MRRSIFLPCLAILLTFLAANRSLAQSGGGHTLFGDFKVDESQASGIIPETFHLLLYSLSGQVVARQPINNDGRYRFFNLSNGEYNLVVEMDNREVARIYIVLAEREGTDIRRDINLEWRAGPFGQSSNKAATVSAADLYKRSSANSNRFEKAQEAIKRNEMDQAIEILRNIVETEPKDFESWTELGSAYFSKQSYDDAEKYYLRALEAQPSYIVALINLGKLKLVKKDFEGAIEVLSRAVQTHPRSADANYFLGESYLQIKKGSKAVGYLNAAIKLDPAGKAEAHLRLAALYNGAGMKDKAALEYEQFLAKKPDYPEKKKLQEYISANKKQ